MIKFRKGFSLLIVVLIVAVIAATGILIFLKKGPKEKESGQIPKGWLTFENKKFNYRISYPPNFHAQEENEPPYPPPPVTKAFSLTYDNGEWCNFEIYADSGVNGLEGEIKSIRKSGQETETVTTLAGFPTSIFDAQGGDSVSRSYYLTKNTTQFRIGYNYKPAGKYSQDCADTVSKMVSTFEFTQ